MLKIFQNIRPISAIYVLVIGILLRLPAIIFGGIEGAKIEVSMMQGFFALVNQNFTLSILMGLLLIFIQAIFFNKLCIDHDVIYAHSYLPAYFYMVISSVYPENLLFNPIMIINFAILFAFNYLFQLYQGINTSKLLYYASLFLGTVSLVMPVYYSGIVFIIVSTIIFKNITLKDMLGIISGYLFPALIAAGVYFLMGKQYAFPKLEYKLQFEFTSRFNVYVALGVIGALTIAGLLKTGSNYTKNNIKTRRITLLMVAYLAFSVLVILIKLEQLQLFFPILTISLAAETAYFLLGNKSRRWKEFFNYVLLATVFFSLYGSNFQWK
ncbi:MAG: hypothetical protein IT244_00395 [Bacteroidia bacterium]|nr:hypothetical protein [Bacteroidia bacterium]